MGSARAASKASVSFLTEINNVASERYAQEVHTLMSCGTVSGSSVDHDDDADAGAIPESVHLGEENVYVGDVSAAAAAESTEATLSSLRLPPGIIHPIQPHPTQSKLRRPHLS